LAPPTPAVMDAVLLARPDAIITTNTARLVDFTGAEIDTLCFADPKAVTTFATKRWIKRKLPGAAFRNEPKERADRAKRVAIEASPPGG